jgi:DNA-binding transcriptional ArsR family regulator
MSVGKEKHGRGCQSATHAQPEGVQRKHVQEVPQGIASKPGCNMKIQPATQSLIRTIRKTNSLSMQVRESCLAIKYIVILRYYITMGITKSALFKKRQNRVATLAKAFDHPARVAILEYLLSHETCICNDLVNEFPLSQSTITQHLKELKRIGIIKGEVEGPKVNYCIDERVWEEAKDIFINMFTKYVKRNDCC